MYLYKVKMQKCKYEVYQLLSYTNYFKKHVKLDTESTNLVHCNQHWWDVCTCTCTHTHVHTGCTISRCEMYVRPGVTTTCSKMCLSVIFPSLYQAAHAPCTRCWDVGTTNVITHALAACTGSTHYSVAQWWEYLADVCLVWVWYW